jgi:hypothetical protein
LEDQPGRIGLQRKLNRLAVPVRVLLTPDPYLYEPLESFGGSLTSRRPWNTSALIGVERLNGRVAMLGFAAAVTGEWIIGAGPAGQVMALLRWYLSLG